MENVHASGMIHMFLSDPASPGGACDMGSEPSAKNPPKQLLLACFGSGLALSEAKAMAVRFGRDNALTTIFNIPDASGQGKFKNLAGYDGIFIGICPDGSGHAERAFSFIRNSFDLLSAKPVALFYILHRIPGPNACDTRLGELSRLCPLDVRSFDRSSVDIFADICAWAMNTVWPLMETRWLADIIFPEPVADDMSREKPGAMSSLY